MMSTGVSLGGRETRWHRASPRPLGRRDRDSVKVSLMRGPVAKVILRRSPVWGGSSQALESPCDQALARGSPRGLRPGSSWCWHHSWSPSAQIPPRDWKARSFLEEIQEAHLHGCPGPRVCPPAEVLSPLGHRALNTPHLRERSHTEIQRGRKSPVVALEFAKNWNLFWTFFGGGHALRPVGILVPRPGIVPVPPAVEVQSPNHRTAREVSQRIF